jgi:hypothetical protein
MMLRNLRSKKLSGSRLIVRSGGATYVCNEAELHKNIWPAKPLVAKPDLR